MDRKNETPLSCCRSVFRFLKALSFASLDKEDLLSPINQTTLQRSSSVHSIVSSATYGSSDDYIGIALPVNINNMFQARLIIYTSVFCWENTASLIWFLWDLLWTWTEWHETFVFGFLRLKKHRISRRGWAPPLRTGLLNSSLETLMVRSMNKSALSK